MPRLLVVLIVSVERDRFTAMLSDGILLRHLAYFTSLAEQPRITDPDRRRRRRVKVPKRNLLTPQALRGLLHPELIAPRSGT